MQPDSEPLGRTLEIAVLVSIGRHPLSGRARRADQDARGVELALSLGSAAIRLLHAGEFDEEVETGLRGYLGMGLACVELFAQPQGADAVPVLADALAGTPAQLVITGERAEQGEGSGLMPFLLAEQLGWSLVSGVTRVESVEAGVATLLQALPRGQRRRVRVRLPAVLTVAAAASAPRQSAFGPARRGELTLIEQPGSADSEALDPPESKWTVQPARKRPKRLKIVKAASARDRFKAAASKADSQEGRVITGGDPQQGAEAIFELLKEQGLLR